MILLDIRCTLGTEGGGEEDEATEVGRVHRNHRILEGGVCSRVTQQLLTLFGATDTCVDLLPRKIHGIILAYFTAIP